MGGQVITGRTAALACALVAVAAGLPGLFALPALDRNESAFVQATVQMLESGDFVAIRYQDYWRGGASPGAHWLQAGLAEALSSPEARAIWPYRLASLFAAALAAAATALGGAALFGPRCGLVAGAGLAVALGVSTAAGVATADAPFLGAFALMLAGLARIYAAARAEMPPRRRDRVLFWAGLIAGVIVKGPLILCLLAAGLIALLVADRRSDWAARLGWSWGLIALFGLAGPWVVAVTIATDGAYWSTLAPPPPPAPALWQTLVSPGLLFPLTVLVPPAAVLAVRDHKEPGVRLSAAFLLTGWAVVELWPAKQVFGVLPLFVPFAWLGAAALFSESAGRASRAMGAAIGLAAGLVGAGVIVYVSRRFGGGADLVTGISAAFLFVLAGLAAAAAVLRPDVKARLVAALVLGAVAPAWLSVANLPGLERLWPTKRILRALADSDLDPREGLAVGPVAAAGYAEPSLVFALGAATETGDGSVAARAVLEGRPAVVETSEEETFRRLLAAADAAPDPIARFDAYDYAGAREITVTIYGGLTQP